MSGADRMALADAILSCKRRGNHPCPNHPGKRIVGWIVDEEVAGLSDGLFAIEEIERRALAHPAEPQGAREDWRDDPTSDERWNAGCDFAMQQLCAALDVDPQKVCWDAATETVEGDIQAVIWNILRTRMGEDWDPDAPSPDRAAAVPMWEESLRKQIYEIMVAYAHYKMDGADAIEAILALFAPASANEVKSSDGTAGKADPQCQRPLGEDTSEKGAGLATGPSEANEVKPEPALDCELTPEQIFLVNDMIHAWIDPEKESEFRESFRKDCKRLLATVRHSPADVRRKA